MPQELTVRQAIAQLEKLNPDQILKVQMSSPNGYTFAIGRVQSIFFNVIEPIIDTFVTSSEDENLMDDTVIE